MEVRSLVEETVDNLAGGEAGEEVIDDGRQWYVIHTYSGYENKVKANLERRIESMEMESKIFRVLVPMEQEYEIKDGKKKISMKKVYPGYVLVEMIMNDDSWYVVRNTPGVTGFVGSGTKPVSLSPQEAALILRRMGIAEPVLKVDFEIGQNVRVIDGPFSNFIGIVEEINLDRGKVRVLVSMFGRETPVELSFMQIESI